MSADDKTSRCECGGQRTCERCKALKLGARVAFDALSKATSGATIARAIGRLAWAENGRTFIRLGGSEHVLDLATAENLSEHLAAAVARLKEEHTRLRAKTGRLQGLLSQVEGFAREGVATKTEIADHIARALTEEDAK